MDSLLITYVLIGAVAVVCVLPFFVALRARSADLFEPGRWAAAYFALLFVLRPLYDLIFGSEFLGDTPFDQATGEAFNLGLIYAWLSFCVFLGGYYSNLGAIFARSFPRLPTMWNGCRAKIAWPLLLGLGFISYFTLVGSFGGWNYYILNKSETLTSPGQGFLQLGSSMMSIGFIMALTQSYSSGGRGYLAYVLLLPILLILGLLTGSKSALLSSILAAMIVTHYLKREIRFRHIVYLGMLTIVLLPILNIYRGITSDSGMSIAFIGDGFQSGAESLIRNLMARFYGIDSLTLLIRDTPKVMDYQLGETIWPLFVSWIPRQFWEDKPIISFGKIFAEKYLGDFFYGTGTSASPTLLGELYLNWHIPGMLFGALLSGIVIRSVYTYFIRRQFGAPAVFIYSLTFLLLFTFWEASIAGMLAEISAPLILLFALVFLVGEGRGDSMRNALPCQGAVKRKKGD